MHEHDITITLVDAEQHEQRFEFEEPRLCLVGRARDCDIATPDSDVNLLISRHHCLLEIDPPSVRVHDLGSTNGTFVNGIKINRKQTSAGGHGPTKGVKLFDGDEVALGPVVLRVHLPGTAQSNAYPDFVLDFDNDEKEHVFDGADYATEEGRKFQKTAR